MNRYLQLIRLPNVLTAAADSWAGFFMLASVMATRGYDHSPSWTALLCVVPASCLFYAVGIIFNDITDFAHDKAHRPERPLPSGRISLNVAFALASVMVVAAILLSMLAGLERLVVAFTLLATIVAYNMLSKAARVASVAPMGLCRALNVALGMGAAMFREPVLLLPLCVVFLLTIAISLTSLSEEKNPAAKKLVRFGVLSLPAVDGIILIAFGALLPSLFCFAICAVAVILSRRAQVA